MSQISERIHGSETSIEVATGDVDRVIEVINKKVLFNLDLKMVYDPTMEAILEAVRQRTDMDCALNIDIGSHSRALVLICGLPNLSFLGLTGCGPWDTPPLRFAAPVRSLTIASHMLDNEMIYDAIAALPHLGYINIEGGMTDVTRGLFSRVEVESFQFEYVDMADLAATFDALPASTSSITIDVMSGLPLSREDIESALVNSITDHGYPMLKYVIMDRRYHHSVPCELGVPEMKIALQAALQQRKQATEAEM